MPRCRGRYPPRTPIRRRLRELAKRRDSLSVGPGGGLHLEGDDATVVSLDDEVDLVTVVGPPVAEAGDPVEPRRLLDELPDHERLEEVPELGERRRVPSQRAFPG